LKKKHHYTMTNPRVRVLYYADIADATVTKFKDTKLLPGDKVTKSFFKDSFDLDVVEEIDSEGNTDVVQFDQNTGDSRWSFTPVTVEGQSLRVIKITGETRGKRNSLICASDSLEDVPAAPIESKATFEAATYAQIKDATGVRTDAIVAWDIAAVVDTSVPLPDGLLARLKNVLEYISIASEADRRIVVNECLLAVVSNNDFQRKLRLSAEVTTEVYGDTRVGQKRKRQYLSGRVDYIIYHFRIGQPVDEVSGKEAQLVTVEAKHGWTDNAMRQCVAEAAAIHKARKDAGKKNCNVWGCLTNASHWRFIHIDGDGALFVSEPFTMALGASSITEQEITKIYQFLYYIVKCAFLASPTTTPVASRRPSQSRS
jgi:hypothetical protein